jgi:hypothetical protein
MPDDIQSFEVSRGGATADPDEGKQAKREFMIKLIPDGTTQDIGCTGRRLEVTF